MANGSDAITITTWPREPLNVNATGEATLTIRQQVPVCLRLCEPICATSEYTDNVTIFDRPVATITVAGITRLTNCDEKR